MQIHAVAVRLERLALSPSASPSNNHVMTDVSLQKCPPGHYSPVNIDTSIEQGS